VRFPTSSSLAAGVQRELAARLGSPRQRHDQLVVDDRVERAHRALQHEQGGQPVEAVAFSHWSARRRAVSS
jgi:hypothetical protein